MNLMEEWPQKAQKRIFAVGIRAEVVALLSILSVVFVPFAAIPSSALIQPPPRLEREGFEEAVVNGLEYLKVVQNRDGSWNAGSQGKDPAISALAVLAFLSAGHVPGEGKYQATVENGIKYVLSTQKPNGVFTPAYRNPYEMYTHGICTLMTAECIGMMPDEAKAKELRRALEQAVKVILTAQRRRGQDLGGWRYTVDGTDADLSVTGWQLMALRSARNVGCDVPGRVVQDAVEYVKRCNDPRTGGYRYQPNNQVTIACTGTAVLCLELSGKEFHRSKEAISAGNLLIRRENAPNPKNVHFFYGVYYGSQGMFQLGDNFWDGYRATLHQLLLKTLPPRANGCWIGQSPDDSLFGANYCTAMAVLALTVEYRYLPIYQRGEE